MAQRWITIDGNEAAASIAYRLSEIIAIYPITPSSAMGEWADAWAAEGIGNLWGTVPSVPEMQSEAGVAGAVHGALQTGALATTFTSSQGLLLMIPNMFKIAGELTPAVFHVAARAVATHARSIFGDHSDVMTARSTGWAMLCAASVQEAQDFAAISHAASLKTRIPFVHFFDGFRTSHEVAKIAALEPGDLRTLIDEELVTAHRRRALTPDRPVLRGSAQNPDVFFQGREASNPFYLACPGIVQETMDRFATLTGRQYRPFEYEGAPDADRVIVVMGSAAETVAETVAALNAQGARVGVLKVRLFRPFGSDLLVRALPHTVRAIAVLDRTKEPGSAGEPLYQDVVTAVAESYACEVEGNGRLPKMIGGRYGLGSKEFTPAMAKAVFDELAAPAPRTHFTVGITDDVTFQSLAPDPAFHVEPADVVRAVFYGLGSDGTVGANKNSIKIIGDETAYFAQGYFVYDSKKAGSITVSHLRFGPRPIRSPFLIDEAGFVACHQWELLQRIDVLERAASGATFLLNSPYSAQDVWQHLPRGVQEQILEKRLRLLVVNASAVAVSLGMPGRINTILQACFFAISGVLPADAALKAIKSSIAKTYGSKGPDVVRRNCEAVDRAVVELAEVVVPATVSAPAELHAGWTEAPPFVRDVVAPIAAGHGDRLAVSLMPIDGTFPVGTAAFEKRNLTTDIPVWEDTICIQCGKCAMVCPHAAIRIKAYEPRLLDGAPATFKRTGYRGAEYAGMQYTIQVAPEDCTGCLLCIEVCPARDKHTGVKALEMAPQPALRDAERENYAFFLKLPEVDRRTAKLTTVKGTQFLQPLFEYSGACTGCGETPYLKLATQLFGDRMIVANATGCTSIYGGNLPTTPWTCNADGRGPAWCNSLFEDNAEFGYGMRLTLDQHAQQARALLSALADVAGARLAADLVDAAQSTECEIHEQRRRVAELKEVLGAFVGSGAAGDARLAPARRLFELADYLVKKSVWIIGGDGWAYDIGYGGLDHVLASGADVNVLVLDTEVYSNTGGQMSKATPRGAVARFAAAGKPLPKKNLGLLAMTYGYVYVATVAMGANDTQTVKAFLEAESYHGPSLIIAYAHCIAHGIDMSEGLVQQGRAVACGHWPLYRFDPRRAAAGQGPFALDSKAPKIPFTDYAYAENRYKALATARPEAAHHLAEAAQHDVDFRWKLYEQLAGNTRPS